MLLFELFPALIAVIALIVGIVLFAVNRRAQNDPDDEELPRTPSQPLHASGGSAPPPQSSGRPSMRA